MERMREKSSKKNSHYDRSWIYIRDLQGLIDAGRAGHYPLFLKSWIHDVLSFQKKRGQCPFSKKEGRKINQIILALKQYQDAEDKQDFLAMLDLNERNLFILAFLTIIEGRILDEGPQLH